MACEPRVVPELTGCWLDLSVVRPATVNYAAGAGALNCKVEDTLFGFRSGVALYARSC